MKQPKLIIADEPTNDLDIINALNVITTIQKLAQTFNCPAIIIIHDFALIQQLKAPVLAIRDGRVIFWDRIGKWKTELINKVYE